MQKKKINSLIGIILLVGLFIFSSLLLPQINKVEAYDGTGPDGNGLYYTLINGGTEYSVTGFDNSITQVEIPATYNGKPVTKIGNMAFMNCSNLTSVTIPNSVTSIGEYAFYYCSSLTSVTIPNSVTSIGNMAFDNCSSLTSITFGEDSQLESIGEWAFYGCSSLESITIPASVTSIGIHAFNGCSSLTSIIIPNSVTSIGDWAFDACYKLVQITNLTAPSLTLSGLPSNPGQEIRTSTETPFINTLSDFDENGIQTFTIGSIKYLINIDKSLITLDLSSYTDINSIYQYGFSFSKSLTSITIPNSVTSIGDYAFYGCTSLASITIPISVTSIGDYAFSNCSSLESITIPASVTSIGIHAFNGCSSLASVEFEAGSQLLTIGDAAFYNSALTSIIIPKNVNTIGFAAFAGASLINIYVDSENTSFKTINNLCLLSYDGKIFYQYANGNTNSTFIIPDTVETINSYSFSKSISLAQVVIPISVIEIFEGVFYLCDENLILYCEAESKPEDWSEGWNYYDDNEDSILTTIWGTALQFTITFKDYDGTILKTEIIEFGESATAPEISERPGYDFEGWDIGFTNVTQDLEVTATYLPTNYSIIYDLNGGANNPKNPTVYTILDNISIQNPTKPGYSFLGWTGTDITSISLILSIPVGTIGDKEYTAKWEIIPYTINYNYNGGSEPGNPTNYNVENETIIFLINPTKTGYTFIGWTCICEEYPEFSFDDPKTEISIPIGSYGNRTYTANWEIETYTISYELDNGTVDGINPISYTIESETITLINPTKTGNTFKGWLGTGLANEQDEYGNYTMEVVIPKGSTGNRFYHIHWEINSYTISFYSNGGSDVENMTGLYYGLPYTKPADPTRDGYTFKGWFTDNGTFENEYEFTTMPAENVDLYAKWEIITYEIEISNLNGENELSNTINYTVETETFTLTQPTRIGYKFIGWTGAGIFDNTMEVTIPKGSMGFRSFLAHWEIVNYTVIYNLDGGTVTGNPDTYTIESGDITLVNPTKTGFTFMGWSGTGITSQYEFNYTIPAGETGDREYTVHWTTNAYRVTFVDWNNSEIDIQMIPYGGSAVPPADPERLGYRFVDWDGNYNNITEDAIVIAYYELIDYLIVYNLNGGIVLPGSNPFNFNIESEEIALTNPVKLGYYFVGWSGTGLTGINNQNVTIQTGSTGDRAYTANWEIVINTISYNLDGGTATGNPDTYTVESATITLNNPTKTGYIFVGWSGTGLTGINNQNVTIQTGSTGDRAYTAHWEIITYTVTFIDWNNIILDTQTVNHGNDATPPVTSIKIGYTFENWDTDYTNVTQDLEVKAIYSTIPYTISYILNGGEVDGINSTGYTIESGDINLINPTRLGYEFKGWSENELIEDAVLQVVIETGTTGNKTYTAHWEMRTFTVIFIDWNDNILDTQTVNYGENAVLPTDPTRTGYSFAGWDKIFTNVTQNLEVKAIYIINTYTISYNLNGGTATGNPNNYNIESQSITLINPTRTGYNFIGWSGTDLIGNNNQVVLIPTGSVGEKAYAANWEIKTYTVIFVDWDNKAIDTQIINHGGNATAPNSPSRRGYNFTGWSSGFTNITQNLEVRATYSVISYIISYNLNGGTIIGLNPAGYNIESGNITLINPMRTGYNFIGWSGTGLTGNDNKNVVIPTGSTEDKNYTSNWEIIKFTITFKDYDGIISTSTINYDQKITKPNDPVKENYEFDGWFANSGLTNAFDFNIVYNSDVEIYAKWSSKVDLVCVVDNTTGEITQNIPLTLGKEYEILTDIKNLYKNNKTGYTLTSWKYTNLTTKQTITITADTTFNYAAGVEIKANYEANSYTVNFDLYYANSAQIESEDVFYDSEINFLPTPTRNGYTFLGWYVDDETKVENGDLYTIPNDVVLRAKWEIVQFNFMWLFIGLGALLIITLITVALIVKKKKKYRNLAVGKGPSRKF